MTLTVVNCHNNVQAITLEPVSVRLEPQLKYLIDWFVGPVNLIFPPLVGAGPWFDVLETKDLLYFVLSRKDQRAQFRLETAMEMSHL